MAYLDNTGLSYFWGKIKSALSSKQNKITASGPLEGDGNGNVTAAETTQAETIPIPAGILKGTASGGIEAATPGTDYEAAPFMITFVTRRVGLRRVIESNKTGEQIEAAFKAGLRIAASFDGAQLDVSAVNANGGYDFVTINADGTIAGVRLTTEDVADEGTGETTTVYTFTQIQYQCMQGPNISALAQNALWGTDSDGFWRLISHIALSNLPAVSADDNGKFLRVVNGAWAIAAIDNANGGSF